MECGAGLSYREPSSPAQALQCTAPPTGPDLMDPFKGDQSRGWSAPQNWARTSGNNQPAPKVVSPLFWSWAGCDSCCLVHLWVYLPTSQVVSQILNLLLSNHALLREPRLPRGLQDYGHPIHMLHPLHSPCGSQHRHLSTPQELWSYTMYCVTLLILPFS